MIWFLSILLVCLGLLLWLPIRLDIDTQKQLYKAEWQGIFAFRGQPEESGWRWYFKLFFWEREWKFEKKETKKGPESPKKAPKTQKRGKSFSIRQAIGMVRQVLRAIRLEHLRVNWDTGDFVLNAWLYPVFRAASRGKRQLYINFLGEQELAIRLQTRLGLLAIAALRVFINSKNY